LQFIDTHTHLYLPEFDSDREEVIANAVNNGVSKLLLPNINLYTAEPMMILVKNHPGICYPMLGLHPTSVKDDYLSHLDGLEKMTPDRRFIAVGETGIDLFWDKTFINEQIGSFRLHIELSLKLDLPIVIHSREAFREIFSVLEDFKGRNLKGVFHAFTGDIEMAEKVISMGFKLGIGGIVTFKNSGLDKVVKEIGPEHLVLETDSPYLAPVPYRGKRNESAYICIINRKLSEIFDMSVDEIASITYRNSMELFKL
jgi:TatD DNase family protein